MQLLNCANGICQNYFCIICHKGPKHNWLLMERKLKEIPSAETVRWVGVDRGTSPIYHLRLPKDFCIKCPKLFFSDKSIYSRTRVEIPERWREGEEIEETKRCSSSIALMAFASIIFVPFSVKIFVNYPISSGKSIYSRTRVEIPKRWWEGEEIEETERLHLLNCPTGICQNHFCSIFCKDFCQLPEAQLGKWK